MTDDPEPIADATEHDDLISETDNSGDPGGEVEQDPDVEIPSDTDDPPEVTS